VAEVRAILAEARPVARGLSPAVEALHAATRAVLTPEQRAWLEANRPTKGKK
jgi:Spy/CpxP family protein refolding chaperone